MSAPLVALVSLLTACSGPPWFPQEPSALPEDPWDGETGFDEDALPCSSGAAGLPAATLFVQNSSGTDVDLWWRDPTCAETLLATIVDGDDLQVGTTWDAAFVVRLPSSGTVVDWFVVRDSEQTEVIE